MKYTTLLLKIAVILLGIPALVLAGLLWVGIGSTAIEAAIEGEQLGYIFLVILSGISLSILPYYASLIQAYKLMTYTEKKQTFSVVTVEALRKFKRFSFMISGIYLLVLPFVFMVAEWDDAPGLVLVGAIPVFLSLVIGLISKVQQHLVQEVISIKMKINE